MTRLGHCTPQLGGHNPLCDRDGRYCSLVFSHAGECQPHVSRRHAVDEAEAHMLNVSERVGPRYRDQDDSGPDVWRCPWCRGDGQGDHAVDCAKRVTHPLDPRPLPPLGPRDQEFVENRMAAAASEAVGAVERLRTRGRHADADELMTAIKHFQDVCRTIRRRI